MKNLHRTCLLILILRMFQPIHCVQNQTKKEDFVPYTTDKHLYNKTIMIRPIQANSDRTIEKDTIRIHYLDWGVTREKITTEIQENCEKVTKEEWVTRYPCWYPTWTGSILSLALLCAVECGIDCIKSLAKKS